MWYDSPGRVSLVTHTHTHTPKIVSISGGGERNSRSEIVLFSVDCVSLEEQITGYRPFLDTVLYKLIILPITMMVLNRICLSF